MDAFPNDWRTADPVVVFDLEYTSWENAMAEGWSRPGQHREVIQIGAVRLAGAAWDEADAIELLVRPRVNPVLSDFIVDLTGITNEAIAAAGLDLAPALARFAAFAGPRTPLLSNGKDGNIIAESCALQDLTAPITP